MNTLDTRAEEIMAGVKEIAINTKAMDPGGQIVKDSLLGYLIYEIAKAQLHAERLQDEFLGVIGQLEEYHGIELSTNLEDGA